MDDVTAAKILIPCLDLTSLDIKDTEAKIKKLCDRAQTPYGNVAAVCVYPKFVALAKAELKNTGIKVATVVNFPKGGTNFEKMRAEIKQALKDGADEIDAVFPYAAFLQNNLKTCTDFLEISRLECGRKAPLKIILETGEIKKSSLIVEAVNLCLKHGADFIKTSTGKTEVSATPEVANLILETIAASKTKAGFKASGGIKTIEEAKKYLILANIIMGSKWLRPENFRIGASSLLNNLLEVIERGY